MDGRYTTYGVRENISTASISTLRAGGPARFCVSVRDMTTLQNLIRDLKRDGISWKVIGGGSNILFPEEGFDGCVIRMQLEDSADVSENVTQVEISVGAGVIWDTFVQEMCSRGLWGVENLSGIPGTVGATPVQNVGAYGTEIQNVITSVRTFDTKTQTVREFSNAECMFGYRDSFFKHTEEGRYIITHVTYTLSKTPSPQLGYKDLTEYFADTTPTLLEIRNAVLAIRSQKFPDLSRVGTAGSFFKNPIVTQEMYDTLVKKYPEIPSYPASEGKRKIPLGWILDKVLHLKGYTKGNVGLFENQSLILVAYAGATAQEIDTFAKEIAEKVFSETKISIEREVVCV